LGYNLSMKQEIKKNDTNLHNQRLGHWGERLAEDYLLDKGYVVLGRNIRTHYGEIDLIFQDEGMLVFVEVKARSTLNFGYPESSITAKKRAHLLNAIQSYLLDHPEMIADWRIDVISIRRMKETQDHEVVHFENALG
jgi:putative endonuclease